MIFDAIGSEQKSIGIVGIRADCDSVGMQIDGNLIDIRGRKISAARVTVEQRRIANIESIGDGSLDPDLGYLLPGFIDAHIHIESSMLVPSEFARLALRHGTVATVSDPHEIANVIGIEGIDFMIDDGKKVPLKFFFGAPSCVPATSFETSGANLDWRSVQQLLARDDIYYLAEMMNHPGVLNGDEVVMRKLDVARASGKPIDGHAPGLQGEEAVRYIESGISTDHECTTLEEAEHKLRNGMKILIREGSAAKNFDALYPLIDRHPESVMFCSDDKHPDELSVSHIDALVRRAIERGCDLFNVLLAACLNPIGHYRLPVGALRVGDPADFIVADDLKSWGVKQTYIDGMLVAENGRALIDRVESSTINHFQCRPRQPEEFLLPRDEPTTQAIEAIDGSLFTNSVRIEPGRDGDVATLAAVNRYQDAPIAKCFIRGFGIQRGAIASCVGHDSHNILVVGGDPSQMCRAVNLIVEQRGGISAVCDRDEMILPLPIAGIMTDADGDSVAADYRKIDAFAKQRLGSTLTAPFMTLSFMALLVIPSLKLSDQGLFDSRRFRFVG
jgi:adenine deaminase